MKKKINIKLFLPTNNFKRIRRRRSNCFPPFIQTIPLTFSQNFLTRRIRTRERFTIRKSKKIFFLSWRNGEGGGREREEGEEEKGEGKEVGHVDVGGGGEREKRPLRRGTKKTKRQKEKKTTLSFEKVFKRK